MFKKPVIIKKSPVVIVKNFIILQSGAVGAFFFASILTNYAKIYRTLPINKLISYHIAESLFLFGAETAIVFFIFFRWYKEYYQIQEDKIIYAKGILYRQRMSIPLDQIVSVAYNQGPLAKLTKYGTIELKGQGKHFLVMKDIPDPKDCADLILSLKRGTGLSFQTTAAESVSDVAELISNGEHEHLEFKSSFRWDVRENRINRNLEKSVMKTVAAFLNSQGGHLVIGVDDGKNILGLDFDYATLGRPDADGFENHFTHVFNNMLGAEFRQFVHLSWSQQNGKDCCLVFVSPASQPAYLKTDSSEEFYIRTGNGTTSLKFSEAGPYIDSHWKN